MLKICWAQGNKKHLCKTPQLSCVLPVPRPPTTTDYDHIPVYRELSSQLPYEAGKCYWLETQKVQSLRESTAEQGAKHQVPSIFAFYLCLNTARVSPLASPEIRPWSFFFSTFIVLCRLASVNLPFRVQRGCRLLYALILRTSCKAENISKMLKQSGHLS